MENQKNSWNQHLDTYLDSWYESWILYLKISNMNLYMLLRGTMYIPGSSKDS